MSLCTPLTPRITAAKTKRTAANVVRVLSTNGAIFVPAFSPKLNESALKIIYTKLRVKVIRLNMARIVSRVFESCFIYILIAEKNKILFKIYFKPRFLLGHGFNRCITQTLQQNQSCFPTPLNDYKRNKWVLDY